MTNIEILEKHIKRYKCHQLDPFMVYENMKYAALDAMTEIQTHVNRIISTEEMNSHEQGMKIVNHK